MKKKSTLAVAVLAAGILFSFLAPSQASASCVCLSERFTVFGSALGNSCTEAQNNLISNLNSVANSSCVSRGYAGACNIVIRINSCVPDPYNPGYRADGNEKYSCSVCF